MGDVKGLFGNVPEHGEPVQSCVNLLRDLLAQAEAGEIVGITYGAVTRRGVGVYGLGGVVGGYSMLGAVELAKAQLVASTLDQEK